jgi:hypothetical protein
MVLPNQTPQYWDTYLPNPDDYETAEEYTAALAAGAEDTSPAHGAYYDPIAGVWRGGRRTEREIALAQYDSGRYMDPNNSFNKGPYAAMRLQNRISNDPDAARLAYGAYDEFGNSLVDPAILAVIEQQLGIGAYESPAPPMTPAPPTPFPPGGPVDEPVGGGPTTPGAAPPPWGGEDPTSGNNPPPIGDMPIGGGPGEGNTAGNPPWTPPGFDGTLEPGPPPIGELPGDGGMGGGSTGPAQLSNAATINPLYPDFMLQGATQQPPMTAARRLGLRGKRNFPMPADGLGGY